MKKEFNAPEMEVSTFTVEDIITTSGNDDDKTGAFDGEWVTF